MQERSVRGDCAGDAAHALWLWFVFPLLLDQPNPIPTVEGDNSQSTSMMWKFLTR